MGLTVWAFILVASLWVLVKSADYFTEYAERFGKLLRLPSFIVGVLIVAVGTSLPEFATSVFGVVKGETDFLSANVLGTVVANILLGLGVVVLLTRKKVTFDWDIISNDLPFFAASIFMIVVALWDGVFNFWEALLFIAGYVVYIFYAYFIQRHEKKKTKEKMKKQLDKEIREEVKESKEKEEKKGFWPSHFSPKFRILFFLFISLVIVAASSYYVVEAVVNLAVILNLGSSVIAATAVALGTSLPEIIVALAAVKRGNFDMVIGDILGSNIFDILMIFGVTGLFTTLTITMNMFIILSSFLVGSFVLLWLILLDKIITKTEALLFVIIYIMFVGKLFNVF